MEVLLDTCGWQRVKPLLLLYLFVVKAAATCPRPQGWENIVLTNEALLLNDFPDGLMVTLECANGYEKENGTGVTTCVGGDWSQPDLICKKKDCGPPKPQPNMSFNTSAGTLFGAIIRIICDKGYRVRGSSYKQCYATGWSGARAKCEIVTCATPGPVTNGRSTWDSQEKPKYGEIVHYVCDKGYTLVGKDHIACGETGYYDSEPPECKGVSTDNGAVMTTSTPPAQEVTEASTTTDSPAPTKAHTDKTHTTSEAPTTTTPSAPGAADIMAAGDKTTTASETSTSFQDKHGVAVDTSEDNGHVPVIVSVICVSLAVCIIAIFLHKFLLRRKGSYANATVPI